MADFIIEKKNFDMQKLNTELSEQFKLKGIDSNNFNKLQLVAEEYLANVLFPDFEGSVEISIVNENRELSLIFAHKGTNYINKMTDSNFLSLKILDNKTKEIESYTKDSITFVKFIF